ncbi:MAG: alpha/beta hydrolase [Oxalobacter sp.]|nr:alpha/beta hydrolase [Oxalobacter sp.]
MRHNFGANRFGVIVSRSVYYLTGMGGRLVEGLGAALLARQVQLDGRELSGEFRRLDFQNQIDLVSEDLMARHWTEESLVIANSFGAYLFLHAQLQLPKYVGRVVLLSPIVGEFCDSEIMMYFSPPRADKLFVLAREGRFVVPDRLEIYVGQDDWQSDPESVGKLFQHTKAAVTIVPDAGHMLPKAFVGKLLDKLIV